MPEQSTKQRFFTSSFRIIAVLILIAGITVRLAVFLQNRNLFIDEANIARNVFERSFLQLATPLSYEQYAPPIFMWVLKLFTVLFGYGEYAFRLFPLLAGIGSLIVMYYLLREISSVRSLWYPLGLVAVSYIMIRYSSEVKQYMSDVLITLSLLLLAVKTSVSTVDRKRFFLTWIISGTIAIWACMPSVFVLAGIGIYYLIDVFRQKAYDKLLPLTAAGVFWIAQFAIYYFTILKPQVQSEYLQEFHQNFFLFATPDTADEWRHNIKVVGNLLEEVGGYNTYSFLFNVALLIAGSILFLWRDFTKALLFLLPIILVLLAAAFNQYSLIPRVALFLMPLMLLPISYCFEALINVRWKIVAVVAVIIGATNIYKHNMIRMIWEKQETEQVTDAMQFMQREEIASGKQVYVHNGARPAFIYYSQIHPGRKRWERIKDAHLLYWDADYNGIAERAQGHIGLIFTSVYPEEHSKTRSAVERHMKEVEKLEKHGCFAYVYQKQ